MDHGPNGAGGARDGRSEGRSATSKYILVWDQALLVMLVVSFLRVLIYELLCVEAAAVQGSLSQLSVLGTGQGEASLGM